MPKGGNIPSVYLQMDEWINKKKIPIILKRREFLTHATTWVNLRDIMLNEIDSHKRIMIV